MRTTFRRLVVFASVLAACTGRVHTDVGEPVRSMRSMPALRLPVTHQRYELTARLDPASHLVEGTARIHFVNESRATVGDLVFHLYLNAFRDDASVFARESRGRLRGVRKHGAGRMDVLELRVDGEDRLAFADTELVPGDLTQMRVPLAEPLAPGRSIDVDVRFESLLPPLFARAGYARDFHVVAQWFPKLAKLEGDGRWASFPYHGNGEFYADFAEYALTVRAPSDMIVASGGERIRERSVDGEIETSFRAWPVHDVMFVAARDARTRESRCDDVALRVVHPSGFDAAAVRHADITCEGLRFFSAQYGRYPYASLTVVIPPPDASGGAGMEYPGLFLTSGPWYAIPHVTRELAEATTAHELAHQWFQGLVATNEVAYPWLDEGITSFVSSDFLVSDERPPFDRADMMRAAALRPKLAGPGLPAYAYNPEDYGRSVYAFSELLFESVARTWGRNRLRAALGAYARAHAFGHPRPADLYAALDRAYYAGFSRDVIIPAVARGERPAFRVLGPVVLDASRVRFVVKRSGPLGFPTSVAITDGRREIRRVPFPADERERTIDVTRDGRICVLVDPDRHVLLDESRRDDRGCTQGPPGGPSWFHRLLPTSAWLLSAFGP